MEFIFVSKEAQDAFWGLIKPHGGYQMYYPSAGEMLKTVLSADTIYEQIDLLEHFIKFVSDHDFRKEYQNGVASEILRKELDKIDPDTTTQIDPPEIKKFTYAKNRKTDVLRLLTALYELHVFENEHGERYSKKEFFEIFGQIMDTSGHEAKNKILKGSEKTNSKIFNDLLKKMMDIGHPAGNEPHENKHDNEFMTVAQTAKFLNLAKNTIYQKVSRMEIPHYKKGKRLYFSKSELMDYLKEGKVKTHDDPAKDV